MAEARKAETTELKVLKSMTNEQKEAAEDEVNSLYNLAIEHYKQALQYIKITGDKKKLQINLINLASLIINGTKSTKQELEISKNYFKKALKIDVTKYNNIIYRALGVINYLQDKPKTALIYHNKAINELLNISTWLIE